MRPVKTQRNNISFGPGFPKQRGERRWKWRMAMKEKRRGGTKNELGGNEESESKWENWIKAKQIKGRQQEGAMEERDDRKWKQLLGQVDRLTWQQWMTMKWHRWRDEQKVEKEQERKERRGDEKQWLRSALLWYLQTRIVQTGAQPPSGIPQFNLHWTIFAWAPTAPDCFERSLCLYVNTGLLPLRARAIKGL